MILRILVFLLILALLELAVLIWLFSKAGFLLTISILLLAGILGAIIARWQGFRVWNKARAEMAAGRPPGTDLFHGLLIAIASGLFVLPGVISDVLAFMLLIPPVRSIVARQAVRWFRNRVHVRTVSSSHPHAYESDEVIDAEFRRVDNTAISHSTDQDSQ